MTSKQAKKKASIHDACVREVVEEMKKDMWEVHADLPGFENPDKIGSFTPDLTATKPGCMKRICEVVTEDMFQGDKQRYQEVKNYCDEYDFHFFVVDKDGKRKEINPATYGQK